MGGGGFVAGPAGLAAALTRTPLVLTEADSHLGLANRLLARRARRVCLAFPVEGREGEPLPGHRAAGAAGGARGRPRARRASASGSRAEARCLLVVGGSQGARSLNFAAVEAFAEDGEREFHVLHLSGKRDYDEIGTRLIDAPHYERYTLIAYEPNLGDVLAACDLVLGRSGGSIFEVTAAGRPAILVPYPHATADHQSRQRRVDGAGRRGDGPRRRRARARSGWRPRSARSSTSPARLSGDGRRLAGAGRPDAARRIADQVLEARPMTWQRSCYGRALPRGRGAMSGWAGGGCTSSASAAPG